MGIIYCKDCEYYGVGLNNGVGTCSHVNALPFPRPLDFCSLASRSKDSSDLDSLSEEEQMAIFKRLKEQRKGV